LVEGKLKNLNIHVDKKPYASAVYIRNNLLYIRIQFFKSVPEPEKIVFTKAHKASLR
jgi:hypothetical protein